MTFYFLMYVLISLCIGTGYAYVRWDTIAESLDELSHGNWKNYGGGPYYVGAALMLSILWPVQFLAHFVNSVRRYSRWKRVPSRIQRLAKLVCLAAVVRKVAEDTLRTFGKCS